MTGGHDTPASTGALVGPMSVRPFTIRQDGPKKRRRGRRRVEAPLGWSDKVLILDTETTTDATQAMLFGSFRRCKWRNGVLKCVQEGLFHADELPTEDAEGFRVLARYARAHGLELMSRDHFIRCIFFPSICELDATVVGFHLPFDLSRLAVNCGEARGRHYGGFSFAMLDYVDAHGERHPDEYYARVCVKAFDSKRSTIALSGGREEHKGKGTRGRFLDARTFAFALTNTSHSLASACTAFGVKHGKTSTNEHGRITPAYIDYNRRDVLATGELLEQLRAEFDRHPIELDPCSTYSPASIAKAYLSALGVHQPGRQFASFPKWALGASMCAYYGGRSEVRVRNAPVPVVYTDFASMYPTDNSLLGNWELLTADRVEVVDATEEISRLLAGVTLERCFDPSFWKELPFFAQLIPDGDVVPVRAEYSPDVRGWNIGVNPLYARHPVWYAGPDLVASILLSGKIPKIVKAFRVVPRGRQSSLQPVRLAGEILVDPLTTDFFRTLPEERARVRRRPDLAPEHGNRLTEFLKVLANSGSYGIFAQVNSQEIPKDKRAKLAVHGNSVEFMAESKFAESAGPFCFPPIAALIPSAARLMLALLERCVTDLGGQYVLCDTDSMAIVATESGGIVPCVGGPLKLPDGQPGIRALSRSDVETIVARFKQLSPYDPDAIPGSILKVESENFDPKTGRQRQLFALAISAKRYALFVRLGENHVEIVKYSEHGLGYLLNPLNPDAVDTDWIKAAWNVLVCRSLGLRGVRLTWLKRPAISRVSVSTPAMLRPLADHSTPYRNRVKPFNFALSAHVVSFGHPADVDPKHFHLLAPYERDPRKWLDLEWTDVYSGRVYMIGTHGPQEIGSVAVKSYRDVLEAYATHPEAKSAAPDGTPCDRSTVGLLVRRPVRATRLDYIGKESRRIEEVESGQLHDLSDVVARFSDPEAEWSEELLPRLRELPRAEAARHLGISLRAASALRTGKAKPSKSTRQRMRELSEERRPDDR
jgi:hypothetical protein